MKIITFALFPVLLLFSCTKNQTIHVLTDKAQGLKIGSKTLFQGMEVGEVKASQIHKGNVLLTLSIDEKYRMTKLSNLKPSSMGIELTQLVGSQEGLNSQNTLKNGDTLNLVQGNDILPLGFSSDMKQLIDDASVLAGHLDKLMQKFE